MTPLIFAASLLVIQSLELWKSQPGWMTVDYLDQGLTADYIVIPMDAYLECYPNHAAGLTPLEE